MTVHCIHIFDRKGKALFSKTYSSVATKSSIAPVPDAEAAAAGGTNTSVVDSMDEQRKLVFGMLFSLGKLIGELTPTDRDSSLQAIQTGASTVHNYETPSGLRFALYTSSDVPNSLTSSMHMKSKSSLYSSSNTGNNTNLGTNSALGSSGEGGGGGGNGSGHNQRKYAKNVLKYVYSKIWVECVVRSPMYKPGNILSVGEAQPRPSYDSTTGLEEEVQEKFDVGVTNFEKTLDEYLMSLPWFR